VKFARRAFGWTLSLSLLACVQGDDEVVGVMPDSSSDAGADEFAGDGDGDITTESSTTGDGDGDGDSGGESSSAGDGDGDGDDTAAGDGDGDGDGYGGFVDPRDYVYYGTVNIAGQVWMTENLRYESAESRCYDDSDNNCVAFGRLYSFNASTTACPPGWHVPDDGEWQTLEMHLGMSSDDAAVASQSIARGAAEMVGTQLKAGGSSGMNILMAGWHDTEQGYVGDYNLGADTYLWSCTTDGGPNIYRRWFTEGSDGVYRFADDPDRYWLSIRCVED
jgi:uncharacterized protein (TIGR02145 family)